MRDVTGPRRVRGRKRQRRGQQRKGAPAPAQAEAPLPALWGMAEAKKQGCNVWAVCLDGPVLAARVRQGSPREGDHTAHRGLLVASDGPASASRDPRRPMRRWPRAISEGPGAPRWGAASGVAHAWSQAGPPLAGQLGQAAPCQAGLPHRGGRSRGGRVPRRHATSLRRSPGTRPPPDGIELSHSDKIRPAVS